MITAAKFYGGSADVVNLTSGTTTVYWNKRVQRFTSSGGTWNIKLAPPPLPLIGFGPQALIFINENAGGGNNIVLRDPDGTVIITITPQKVALLNLYPESRIASKGDLLAIKYRAYLRDLFMT